MQEDFLFHAELGFDEILSELEYTIEFNIFLVGFETDGSRSVRIEPDVLGFPVEELENLYQALHLPYAPPPDPDAPTDEAYKAEIQAHAYYCREVWSLLSDVLRAEIDLANTLSFCSQPQQVENHLVALVLLISRSDYDKHPQLNEAVAYAKRGYHPSFMHAVIDAYLQLYSGQITMPIQESFLLLNRSPRELIRSAGVRFTSYAAYAGRTMDPIEIMKKGPYELFEACNVISSMRYEGADGFGRMIIARKGHPAISVEVEFLQHVEVSDYRKVRKLLEMCNEKTCLLSADRQIYGLGFVDYNSYAILKENLFEIRFIKHHSWELVHGDRSLMVTTFNEARLPMPKFDEDDLRAKLRRWVPGVTDVSVEKIVRKGRMASEAKYGTTLIISGDAASEAFRLGRQGFPVVPFEINALQMKSATSIDGGILLDSQGVCFGVGVLLDGKATLLGDPARGSRYNSAVRYVEGQRDAVVLVVSEDGMVNIVARTEQRLPMSEAEPPGESQPQNYPSDNDIRLAAYYLHRNRGPLSDSFRDWLSAERGLYFRRRRRFPPAD